VKRLPSKLEIVNAKMQVVLEVGQRVIEAVKNDKKEINKELEGSEGRKG